VAVLKRERPLPIGGGIPAPQAGSPVSHDVAAVRTQLERILASSPFRNSKRILPYSVMWWNALWRGKLRS
jgi:hypothetical protein